MAQRSGVHRPRCIYYLHNSDAGSIYFPFFSPPPISHILARHVFPFAKKPSDGAARLMHANVIWEQLLADCCLVRLWDEWRTSKKHRDAEWGSTKEGLVYSRSPWPHAGFTERVFLLPCDASFFTPAPRKLTSHFAERIRCDCGCMDALFLRGILMLRDQHGVSFNVTGCRSRHSHRETRQRRRTSPMMVHSDRVLGLGISPFIGHSEKQLVM